MMAGLFKPIDSNASQLLWDCWQDHANSSPQSEAIIHWNALEEPVRWTYSSLLEAALNVADRLMKSGVKNGDICALIMRHHRMFYPLYMGVSAFGAVPAVLAYPNPRLHPEKFTQGLSGIARKSGLDWVMTERALEPAINAQMKGDQHAIKGVLFPLEWETDMPLPQPDKENIDKSRQAVDASMPCLLQFSSGTTGLQKGVVLTHRALLEHVKRYAEAIRLGGQDKIVSWLPLYHDMGLIAAFHMPLIYGIPTVQLDPFQWVLSPGLFFQAISRERATLAWLPNFAYNLLAGRINNEEMKNIDLGSMRMFINCSEVVRARTHERFLNCFGKYGVKPGALAACYAMAEATFAVTQTPAGVAASELALDREGLLQGVLRPPSHAAARKVCVSSGKLVSGCSLKILDKESNPLPEDHIGAIALRSVSLFEGYRNNPDKTAAVMKDGWYHSGDFGFCHQGEYYILGRTDDLLIIAGQNIYPEDIEDQVGQVPGVIAGRMAVFGADDPETGTQKVCVIAETACQDEGQKELLKAAVVKAALDINITISEVHLVPPRWLIKSSSGKISRQTNRQRIQGG